MHGLSFALLAGDPAADPLTLSESERDTSSMLATKNTAQWTIV